VIANFLNIAFSGIAYGVLLFLMAAGLSVTQGLMNFLNLTHAVFAMVGGYLAVTLMNQLGWPFFATLPVATLGAALLGMILERTLFRRMYGADRHLDQIMLTIGLTFMAVAATTYIWGPNPLPVRLPSYLTGLVHIGFLDLDEYRLFLIAVGIVLITLLILGFERTSFGAKIRAAVDNRRVTASCGINVDRLFMLAFLIGSGLAGLGGALSVNLLSVDPNFAVAFLAYMLIVVVLGGQNGSIKGALGAALLLGIADVVGKYYVPQVGAFIIYTVTVLVLFWRPNGLFAKA
jgi:branched-chain amino acid transport system permease protein